MPRGGRNVPGLQQRFALKGKLLVKYYRGQLVVQSWPKAYGPPRSEAQANTMKAFQRFQRAVKFYPPQFTIQAMELTQGTGMYPRDLLMAAALGTNVMLGYSDLGARPMIGDSLAKFVAVGGEATATFDNIPPGYSTVEIEIIGRESAAANDGAVRILCNGDTGNHYDAISWNQFGTTYQFNQPSARIGALPAGNAAAHYPGSVLIRLIGYGNPNFYKPMISMAADQFQQLTNDSTVWQWRSYWRGLDPVNRIDLTFDSGLIAGSTITVRGLF